MLRVVESHIRSCMQTLAGGIIIWGLVAALWLQCTLGMTDALFGWHWELTGQHHFDMLPLVIGRMIHPGEIYHET